MKKMKKTLILFLVMLLSFSSIQLTYGDAVTETSLENLKNAISQSQNGDVIKLTNGGTLNEMLTISKSITIDINGNDVSINTINVSKGANVTLRDTGNAKGKLQKVKKKHMLNVYGTLNLQGIVLDGGKLKYADREADETQMISVGSGGVLNIEPDTCIQNGYYYATYTESELTCYIYCEGTINMNGGEIKDGKSTKRTISLYGSNSKFNLTNGTIHDNSAKSGGGVTVQGGRMTMTGGEIHHNSASSAGGGVYVSYGEFIFKEGKIHDNQSNAGGGVCVLSTGYSNYLLDDGQEIKSGFIMLGGEIYNNIGKTGMSFSQGGGVSTAMPYDTYWIGNVYIAGGKIHNNKAHSGGGLFISSNSSYVKSVVKNVEIYENEATTIDAPKPDKDNAGIGGGIFFTGSEHSTTNVKIHSNKAERYGGGIYAGYFASNYKKGSYIMGSGTQIYNNIAGEFGDDIAFYPNSFYKNFSKIVLLQAESMNLKGRNNWYNDGRANRYRTSSSPTILEKIQFTDADLPLENQDKYSVGISGGQTFKVTMNDTAKKETVEVARLSKLSDITTTFINKIKDDHLGYDFDGWNEVEDITNYEITTDLNLTAKWIQSKYTVTYKDGVNGEAFKDEVHKDLLYNDSIPDFEGSLTRTGYAFDGWYLDSEYEEELTETLKVTDNLELYAKWHKLNKISFDLGDGESLPDEYVDNNEKLSNVPKPEKYNYIFDGWYTDKNLKTAFDSDSNIVSDLSLHGQWIKAYRIQEGEKVSYQKGTEDKVKIIVKRSKDDETCFSHFKDLKIGDKTLKRDTDYEAESGSTVIKLNSAYLEGLENGNHHITIEFDDGLAEAELTVIAEEKQEGIVSDGSNVQNGGDNTSGKAITKPTKKPSTSDDTDVLRYFILIGLIGVTAAVSKKKLNSKK